MKKNMYLSKFVLSFMITASLTVPTAHAGIQKSRAMDTGKANRIIDNMQGLSAEKKVRMKALTKKGLANPAVNSMINDPFRRKQNRSDNWATRRDAQRKEDYEKLQHQKMLDEIERLNNDAQKNPRKARRVYVPVGKYWEKK